MDELWFPCITAYAVASRVHGWAVIPKEFGYLRCSQFHPSADWRMPTPDEVPYWVRELDERASNSFPEWMEFFYYQGRPIGSTRGFCRERANKYFHRKEIEEWGRNATAMPWKGMNKRTNEVNIFLLLGGMKCRHSLMPVRQGAVPAEDLERMRLKGLIP